MDYQRCKWEGSFGGSEVREQILIDEIKVLLKSDCPLHEVQRLGAEFPHLTRFPSAYIDVLI